VCECVCVCAVARQDESLALPLIASLDHSDWGYGSGHRVEPLVREFKSGDNCQCDTANGEMEV
jgi:hypothetical protein